VRILAIDPGNEQSAWCETVNGSLWKCDKLYNADVLDLLRNAWDAEHFLAIEMIASYGMAVGKEVFDTCLWIGRFMEAWEARGGTVRLVYRREVKLHLCESARANDANIRAALIDKYGPGKAKAIGTKKSPGPLFGVKGDEWSALAVALTAEAAINEKCQSYADVRLPMFPMKPS
jgi:hypothetical protein